MVLKMFIYLRYQNDNFVKCKIQLNYTKVPAKLHIFNKYIYFLIMQIKINFDFSSKIENIKDLNIL